MLNRAKQRGLAMIETLIAILVLAVGVIGAAGMQLSALRTSQQSAARTAALELASEIADKMRANDHAMSTDSGNPFVGLDYRTSDAPRAPGASCYGDAHCDPSQLASFDVYEWERRLKSVLPAARAVICRDAHPWDKDAHAYRWACDAASGGTGAAPLTIKIGWLEKGPVGNAGQSAGKAFAPAIVLIVEPYAA